jgi:hypothetical protein
MSAVPKPSTSASPKPRARGRVVVELAVAAGVIWGLALLALRVGGGYAGGGAAGGGTRARVRHFSFGAITSRHSA